MLYRREKKGPRDRILCVRSQVSKSGHEAFPADMGAPWRSEAEAEVEAEYQKMCPFFCLWQQAGRR